MNTSASPPLPPALIDEAIHWTIQLDFSIPSPATRQAFETWLHAHPTHLLAWQRMQSLQGDFGHMPSRLALDTLQAAQRLRQDRGPRRRKALQLLSGSGLVAALGWLGHAHTPWQRLLADASTSVGGQRTWRSPMAAPSCSTPIPPSARRCRGRSAWWCCAGARSW